MLQKTRGCIYLFEIVVLFSSYKYLEIELLDHIVVLFLFFWRTIISVFLSGRVNLHSHQQCTRVPFAPHPQHLLLLVFFDNNHFNRCEMVSHCGLICLRGLVMLNTFSCMCWLFVWLFWENVSSGLLLILKLDYLFFWCWIVWVSLYILYTNIFVYFVY